MASSGSPDTLLRAGAQADTWLDITHAHPSGLAQLLAGRPTRLSSLVREPGAHIRARRRARAIRASAADLAAERGIRGCYLAAGLATWSAPDPTDPGAEPPSAPVLLRGCTLRPRGADDYDLDLDESAVVNPELVRTLALAAGVAIDGPQLGGLAFGREGFDPRPVFEWLEERCGHVPGFRITRGLVIATFTAGSGAVLADLDAMAVEVPRHDLLARIATPDGADPPAGIDPGPLRPLDRDPADELLVLDLDPAQQAAVDAVAAGGHVAVEGPPGTGVTQVLAAAAGQLAAAGGVVLVLAPRRPTADAFLARLEAAGLRGLALDLPDGAGGRRRALGELCTSLDGLDRRPGGDPDAERAAMHLRLRRARELLSGTSRAMHAVRDPWQVSVQTALDRLADLGSGSAAAAPLPPAVLARLDPAGRERLREQLLSAAGAGAFNLTRVDTRWLDARVDTDEEAERALRAAQGARDALPIARAAMDRICAAAGIASGATVAQWRPRLTLLLGVRATLDALLPAVFERPLDALVEVTAPGAKRRASGTGRGEWRRTRRRAWSLVRPGVHATDLHAMLERAQEERVRWRELVGGAAPPTVPAGLTEADAAVDHVVRSLAALRAVLTGPHTPDLLSLPLEDLQRRLIDLAADEAGVLGQPRRSTTLRELRAAGLGALVDDLRERRVGPKAIDAELDLAWWSGVLEAVSADDPQLVRHRPEALATARKELRSADADHVADGCHRVIKAVTARARTAVQEHPDQVQWLRAELTGDNRLAWPGELFRRAGHLVAALRPIWVLSPDTVARSLSPDPTVAAARPDTVIIDDAGNVGLPEVVAALARSRQVVVGGDRRRLPPPDGMTSALAAVARLTPVRRLDRDHRVRDARLNGPLHDWYPLGWHSTPGVLPTGPLQLELVEDGTGVPGLGETIAVSPDAEVRRVVELVTRHAVERGGQSLMVTTFGERHAERIEAALRSQAAYRPELSRWLAEHWRESGRGEVFAVRSAQRALGLERDVVIVTVGLARTPHGRVLHRFGSIDEPHGEAALLGALTRARRGTSLVCCFTADDLADDRLRSDGARLLHRVLIAAEASVGPPGDPAAPAQGLVADLKDRLVTAGLRVREGPVDAGWPVDLVVEDDDGRGLLAIDLDGEASAARGWRERDRQRADRLERAGWTYCAVPGLGLARDPAAEVDRIREVWRRACGLDRS